MPRSRDLLGQLYVLLPVLDDDKHYWVTRDEIDKLAGGAAQWLAGHPDRDLIIRRYLRHQPGLVREATARLLDEDLGGPETRAAERDAAEQDGTGAAEHARLRDLRAAAVLRELRAAGARRVLDLGCGDGRLLALLLADPQFDRDRRRRRLRRRAGTRRAPPAHSTRWRRGSGTGSGCCRAP